MTPRFARLSFRNARAVCRRLLHDRSGASAVFVALVLPVMIGFAGLGIDIGYSYLARRSLQGAADSAAFSAATALAAGESGIAAQARAVTAQHGFEDGEGNVVVRVATPPTSGPSAGMSQAVEVVIEQPGRRFFSGLFVSEDPLLAARAVARVGRAAKACVMALDPEGNPAIEHANGATLVLSGCALWANSSAAEAVQIRGGARLAAESVGVVGGYSVTQGAHVTAEDGIHSGEAPVGDPYADMPVPSYSGCTYNAANLSSGTYGGSSLPTVFCNGLRIANGATVHFEPGIYFIDRGTLEVAGGSRVTGTGVTFVLTSSTGTDYATVRFDNGSRIDLTAPDSGPTAGVVLYQDRSAPSTGTNVLEGGSQQTLRGAVYLPNQMLRFANGASTSSGCTQIIAGRIAFQGGSRVGMNCGGTPIRKVRGVKLIE
ncbi:TadE/TadG family type IV pilus assembly protein [Altericroceibacterium xinjiangense]|uniref:TadE/TadG family type IV pilus assembly protein n=1 Tax=Altericroceibacterium xinjiangense TaxID=762261 RepID=UPI0019D2B0BD|nr:TadE/TadG family type IV pilus assembly protein [Altericroceibacterium xinjiangense]